MHNLTEEQKAYLAASMDGDGCFNISKQESKYNKFYYHSHITIGNTNIEFLQYIKRITEIGTICISAKETENHKIQYQWKIDTMNNKIFTKTILPYLIAKIPRANLILEFLELKKIKYGRGKLIPLNIEIDCDILFDELTEYNKRGPTNIYYNKYPKILTTNHIKQMNNLTNTQIAYIAGLVDTEGLISLNRYLATNRDIWNYGFDLSIGNTDTNLLNYIIKITNLGKIVLQSEETKTAKRYWRWELGKFEIFKFLNSIKSNLITKNRLAEILIEALNLTKTEYGRWCPRPKENSDKLEKLYYESEELNIRGPLKVI